MIAAVQCKVQPSISMRRCKTRQCNAGRVYKALQKRRQVQTLRQVCGDFASFKPAYPCFCCWEVSKDFNERENLGLGNGQNKVGRGNPALIKVELWWVVDNIQHDGWWIKEKGEEREPAIKEEARRQKWGVLFVEAHPLSDTFCNVLNYFVPFVEIKALYSWLRILRIAKIEIIAIFWSLALLRYLSLSVEIKASYSWLRILKKRSL